MASPTKSVFSLNLNPTRQMLMVLAANVFMMGAGAVIKSTGMIPIGERFPWMTAAAFLLFFSVFNSVYYLSTKDMGNYWSKSVISFVILALSSGLLAYLFSSLTIGEAGSYRWIFIVVTIGYLVFISIMGFMRVIVDFAEKEDWKSPKKRKR